jgi:hypothetical protein
MSGVADRLPRHEAVEEKRIENGNSC